MAVEGSTSGVESIAYLVAIGLAAGFSCWQQYRQGHKDEDAKKPAEKPIAPMVILESAELADLSTLTRLCKDLKPGLEKLAAAIEDDRDLRQENNVLIKDVLVKVTRLDNELDVNKRLEEKMLAARLRDNQPLR